jgi:hypothetical protein
VNTNPLLANPPTTTTTLPVDAPLGTVVTSLVLFQIVTVAGVPLKVTVLFPCVDPKFEPAIVTDVPTTPALGDKLEIVGGTPTINVNALLSTPPTVTNNGPVLDPLGTVVAICVLLQLVVAASVPLNLTVLLPWVPPKFDPVIVTGVLMGPNHGETF